MASQFYNATDTYMNCMHTIHHRKIFGLYFVFLLDNIAKSWLALFWQPARTLLPIFAHKKERCKIQAYGRRQKLCVQLEGKGEGSIKMPEKRGKGRKG